MGKEHLREVVIVFIGTDKHHNNPE
jgi:hypothetical protein